MTENVLSCSLGVLFNIYVGTHGQIILAYLIQLFCYYLNELRKTLIYTCHYVSV